MKRITVFLLTALTMFAFFSGVFFAKPQKITKKSAAKKSVLAIEVAGFRNEKGILKLSLFNSAEGFPGQYEKAFKTMAVEIKGATVTAQFTDIPAGEYAVSIIHDENDNHLLDTGIFGIPAEGVGASNNPKGGPPKYQDAKFVFDGKNILLKIKLVYIL